MRAQNKAMLQLPV